MLTIIISIIFFIVIDNTLHSLLEALFGFLVGVSLAHIIGIFLPKREDGGEIKFTKEWHYLFAVPLKKQIKNEK